MSIAQRFDWYKSAFYVLVNMQHRYDIDRNQMGEIISQLSRATRINNQSRKDGNGLENSAMRLTNNKKVNLGQMILVEEIFDYQACGRKIK